MTAHPAEVVEVRDLPGYPGYRVRADGHVLGRDGRVLRPRPHRKTGHLRIRLYGPHLEPRVTPRVVRGKPREWRSRFVDLYVHQAVALAFIGPPPFEGALVRHADDVPTHNWVSNLSYGTREDNEADKQRNQAQSSVDDDGFDWATGTGPTTDTPSENTPMAADDTDTDTDLDTGGEESAPLAEGRAAKHRPRKIAPRRRKNVGIGLLDLGELRVDAGIQQRVALDSQTVEAYAEAIREGAKLPPLIAFEDEDDPAQGCWLADGFHREAAYRAAGVNEVEVDLRRGTRRDAILYSVGANHEHGLRRTNADKRRAVGMLLGDPEWGQAQVKWIAEQCRVSERFVATVKAELKAGSVLHGAVATTDVPEQSDPVYPTREPPPGEWTAAPLEQALGARLDVVVCPPATNDQVLMFARQLRSIWLPGFGPGGTPVALTRLQRDAEEEGAPPDLFRRSVAYGAAAGWWRVDGDVVIGLHEIEARYDEPESPAPSSDPVAPLAPTTAEQCGAAHPVTGRACTEPAGHPWTHGYVDDGKRVPWENPQADDEAETEPDVERCGSPDPVTGRPCTEAVGHTWSHAYYSDGHRNGWPNTLPNARPLAEQHAIHPHTVDDTVRAGWADSDRQADPALCGSRHPNGSAWCGREPGHDGPHKFHEGDRFLTWPDLPPAAAETVGVSAPRPVDSDSWSTPDDIIERVRATFGGTIDLDPCTNGPAQQRIRAVDHYTKARDGLQYPWYGQVFLNPPYSHPLVEQFTAKLLEEIDADNVTEAVVLLNACTDTKWQQAMLRPGTVMLLVAGRIPFVDENNEPGTSPRLPQVVLYYGKRPGAFRAAFEGMGTFVVVS